MVRLITILLVFCHAVFITGCIMPPATSNPMDAVHLDKNPGKQSEIVFVFLPGRRDEPEDFIKNGFIDDLWKKGINADVVIADAHLGYYYERIFDDRLMQDIINPLKEKGYKEIWAVGVSLGGFGAVMFERDHPDSWDGIIMIAPFIGDQDDVLKQVRESEGIDAGKFAQNLTDDDYTARFWQWIQSYGRRPSFPIYIGLGTDDRMYEEQVRLLDAMDADRVIQIPGGHNWKVWETIWQQLLDAWVASEYEGDGSGPGD